MERKNIGAKIAYYRSYEKWTQKTLAQKMGYSARLISDWETGKTEPSIEAIQKLVQLFSITYNELFDDL